MPVVKKKSVASKKTVKKAVKALKAAKSKKEAKAIKKVVKKNTKNTKKDKKSKNTAPQELSLKSKRNPMWSTALDKALFGSFEDHDDFFNSSQGGGMMDDLFGDDMMMPFGRGGGADKKSKGGRGTGDSMMQMMNSGDGFSSSSCMVMSSSMGKDGKMQTEKFASSNVRDGKRKASETQQAYSNSASGVDKMSLERRHEDRGRKMVKEYNRNSGEGRQHQYLKGMDEGGVAAFDDRWGREVAQHLPSHARLGAGAAGMPSNRAVQDGRGGDRRRSGAKALMR